VTVAGAMNSAVGLASAEEVGLSKNTLVGKTWTIKAGDRLEITVGKSRIVMESNGNISILGANINIAGSESVQIDGQSVDVN
jgi:type VI secretion system secreted protein VgrG